MWSKLVQSDQCRKYQILHVLQVFKATWIRIWFIALFERINNTRSTLLPLRAHVRHVFAVPALTFVATFSATQYAAFLPKIVSVKPIGITFISNFLFAHRTVEKGKFEPTKLNLFAFLSWELARWIQFMSKISYSNHR